jgi:5-formyltetrahydrofolate cyclo-ligase
MSARTQREQRKSALRARRELAEQARLQASRRICHRFLNSRYFYSAQQIGCYISMPDEVDTSDILARAWQASKQIYCPVVVAGESLRFVALTRESRLVRSGFGLLEPVNGEEILPLDLDVVVVPVVAFDETGRRIGMGGGYYDRTFRALANRRGWMHPKLVGVAFDCQKVPKIKANPWDIALSAVLTESS